MNIILLINIFHYLSQASKNDILRVVQTFLLENINLNILSTVLGSETFVKFNEEFLHKHVKSINICNENKLSGVRI